MLRHVFRALYRISKLIIEFNTSSTLLFMYHLNTEKCVSYFPGAAFHSRLCTRQCSVYGPICQEGQSERTFPVFAVSSRFFLFSPIFPLFFLSPDFVRFWAIFFAHGQGALCPLPPLATLTRGSALTQAN